MKKTEKNRLGIAEKIVYPVLALAVCIFSFAVVLFSGTYSRNLAFDDPAVLAAARTGPATFLVFAMFFVGMAITAFLGAMLIMGIPLRKRADASEEVIRDLRWSRRVLACLTVVFAVLIGVSSLTPNAMCRLYDDGSLTVTGLTGKVEKTYAASDFGKVRFGTYQDVEGDTKNATLRVELTWKEDDYAFELYEFRGADTKEQLASMNALRRAFPSAKTDNMVPLEDYYKIVDYSTEEKQLVRMMLTELTYGSGHEKHQFASWDNGDGTHSVACDCGIEKRIEPHADKDSDGICDTCGLYQGE